MTMLVRSSTYFLGRSIPSIRQAFHLNRFSTSAIRFNITKEALTPLASHLIDQIKISGPITVAQYMRTCLTHPLGGYYTKGDVFGAHGDFTTSPEISQMFGELVAIWFINYWQTRPSTSTTSSYQPIRLIELGPGRGTLMHDIITTLRSLSMFGHRSKINMVTDIHLVESSPRLRDIQKKMILKVSKDVDPDTIVTGEGVTENGIPFVTTFDDVKVYWHDTIDTIDQIPSSSKTSPPVYYIAHEFFDALPIHHITKTSIGYRETLVTTTSSTTTTPFHFTFTKSPSPTFISNLIPSMLREQYGMEWDIMFKDGDTFEISMDTIQIMSSITNSIKKYGGSAMIMDYGSNHMIPKSLRGIRNHQFVNPLSSPGITDITADVNFKLISYTAHQNTVFSHGPIPQGLFLTRMGIGARALALIQSAYSDHAKKDIVAAYERLVDPMAMGTVYKVMVVTDTQDMPYAFEPDDTIHVSQHQPDQDAKQVE